MLPAVIRFNGDAAEPLYAGLWPADAGAAAPRLAARVEELKRAARLPERLRECAVKKEELPELARLAVTQWTAKFNPRPLLEGELLGLYEAAY